MTATAAAAALGVVLAGCGTPEDMSRWGAGGAADASVTNAGGEPEQGEAARDPRCPEGTVYVPAGEFVGGATGEDIDYYADWPSTEHLPRARKVRSTDAFCIDTFESPNVEGELPRTYVSWDEAVRLCAARGRRLCTEDEWTKACAGSEGWLFPYGESYVIGRCNADVTERVGDPTWIRPTGAFPRCVSPYGAVDMEGNVSEWVDAVSEELPEERIVRGGTMWVGVYGRGCMSRHRHPHEDASHEDDGFRCCVAPLDGGDEAAGKGAPSPPPGVAVTPEVGGTPQAVAAPETGVVSSPDP